VPAATALLVAGLLLLLILLGMVTREWLVLRARQRQRGLFRRWPIPRITLDQLGSRFRPDALGPTLATEVTFVGRSTLRVPGGTSDAEAWILAVVAKDARMMFEFGTCTGKTAYLWARNQPAGGTVTTLTLPPEAADQVRGTAGDDPVAVEYAREESRFSRFLYNGTEAEGRIVQVLGDSKQFDERPFAGQCDVVFVDGSHAYSYVVSDSAKALRMVRPGGLVLWHDYSPECPGVFHALNELGRRLPLGHVEGTTLVAHRRDRAVDS
jgi:predicted O-methyltransferase YrrM